MSADYSTISVPEEQDAEMKNGRFLLRRIVRWGSIVLLCFSLLGCAVVLLLTLLMSLNAFSHDLSIEMPVFDTLGEIAMWIGVLLTELLALGFNYFILKRVLSNER